MKNADLEKLRAYYERVKPLLAELFNMAYAICGAKESAECALLYTLMEGWESDSHGNIALREMLRNTVRDAASDEAVESKEACTWNGNEFAQNPKLELLEYEPVQVRRLIVLRCGCNLKLSVIAGLLNLSQTEAKRELVRFKRKWAKGAGVSEHRAEAELGKILRRQMRMASSQQPDSEAMFRTFTEEALQTKKPMRIVSTVGRGVLEALVVLLCALLFWLVAVLIRPIS